MQYDYADHLFVLHFLAAGFGSQGWMTDPFGLAPSVNGAPFVNDVGTGQQSSYREQTYTLPGGAMSYQEWSG